MKSRLITLIIFLTGAGFVSAQNTLVDRKGHASFYSKAPIEDIEALNEEVIGAIDLDKGTLAVSILIKEFHFDKSLMEEHFNENYLESDKFPRATYKGIIKNFATLDFSKKGSFEAETEGEIEIHGVTRPLKVQVLFDVIPTGLKAETSFKIALADFDVEIPKLLFKNIAEVIDVKALFNFSREGS